MASDVCSHVKVVVRVRPLNDSENCENFKSIVQVVDNHMLIFDPKEMDTSSFGARKLKNRNIHKRANKDLKFVFDYVFGEDSTQEDIFENTTKGVLDGLLNGFNCTVFAYGSTGAGKTHTMLGSPNDPGVMYRTMKELFKRMDDAKEEKVFEIAFSYLEVYNEQIRDLLADVGPLAVREDDSKRVVVQGLTLHQPKSAEELLKALDFGNRNRTQHPTDMNATSSRSHAVFQIYLKQQDKTASLNPNVCIAKMSLIDLAGSERASATKARGARLREGANINRSLLALGNVINVLADPKSKKTHIPYRDSKLTRLLKDSLGGNCRTVMIANISPSSKSHDDTHNTLKYANRAKEIKSSLRSNVVSLKSHIGQYVETCEKQRQEIIRLKQKLKDYEEKRTDISAPNVSSQEQVEFKKLSESLRTIFSCRARIRRDQLDLERQLKENELRQRHSEEGNQQVQLLCAKERTEKATCKHERKMASLRTQQQHIQNKLKEAEARFLENDGWLHRVQNEMKLLGQNAQTPEVLEKELHAHRLELQVNDLKQHYEQMIRLAALQDQENRHMLKMMNVLLPGWSRHYLILRQAGLVTTTDYTENQEVEHLVLRERGVVWADQEAEPDQKGEGAPKKADDSRDLVPLLSFSNLRYHQNSPCRPQSILKQRTSFRNPTRRALSMSLPPHSPGTVGLTTPQDREEGTFPLQCTLEPAPKSTLTAPSCPPPADDPNTTFEVRDSGDQTAADSTIVVYTTSPCQGSNSSDISVPCNSLQLSKTKDPLPNSNRLQDMRRVKPPYMAMTSAAQGKRKLNGVNAELQDTSAPKRVKHDSTVVGRPLRVNRFTGSDENKPRRVMRSISEGNINLVGVQKSRSLFCKTSQQIKRVAKNL